MQLPSVSSGPDDATPADASAAVVLPSSPSALSMASEPQSPEEAVIMLLMQAGRRLRTRHPEDELDPSSFPLAKQLMCGDAMRVSDVAARLGLDASTVSRQIKQLEDKGIIERTADPADGRASLVQLSSAGHTTMQSAFRRRFQRIQKVLLPWSEHERTQLQHLLTRLAHDLADANDRAAAELDDARPQHGLFEPDSSAGTRTSV